MKQCGNVKSQNSKKQSDDWQRMPEIET